jgi:hypothetical protein
VIGLWPFSFKNENDVRRLKKEAGVEFYDFGIVFTGGQLKKCFFSRVSEHIDAISIEIWLKPDKKRHHSVRKFLCFFDDQLPPFIGIGQEESSLIIRIWGEADTYFKESKKIELHNALPNGVKRFLTITSGVKGTTIYLDGKRSRFYPNRRLLHSKNNFLLPCLVLGNDPTGKMPWNGKIFGLSIYDKELSGKAVVQNFQLWTQGNYSKLLSKKGLIAIYPIDEISGQLIYNRLANKNHLYIPDKFQVPKPLILSPPIRGSRLDFEDIIMNILFFIPLGFLSLAYFSSIMRLSSESLWLLLIVVLLGGFLSLAIEFLQIFIPTRYSSSTDLICNILGTATGAVLLNLFKQKSLTSNLK